MAVKRLKEVSLLKATFVQQVKELFQRTRAKIEYLKVQGIAKIAQLYSTSSLLKTIFVIIVQKLCESRGGRPGLSVLTSLLVSVDVKNY